MVLSETVAYFIILATGATLFASGHHHVASATEAAQALRPMAGDLASLLLAVGLAGAGLLAVPVLTGSAAYGVSEAFGWRFGLDREPRRAPQFYAVIVAATLVGMVISLVANDPMGALVVAAVVNGLLAPPILVLVMLISRDRTLMGQRTNGRLLDVVGWATTGITSVAALALIATTILG
jgi:Mn2+/Fe2+ NRAMP family transporter